MTTFWWDENAKMTDYGKVFCVYRLVGGNSYVFISTRHEMYIPRSDSVKLSALTQNPSAILPERTISFEGESRGQASRWVILTDVDRDAH